MGGADVPIKDEVDHMLAKRLDAAVARDPGIAGEANGAGFEPGRQKPASHGGGRPMEM